MCGPGFSRPARRAKSATPSSPTRRSPSGRSRCCSTSTRRFANRTKLQVRSRRLTNFLQLTRRTTQQKFNNGIEISGRKPKMAKNTPAKNQPNIDVDDLKAPLLAAVGAADLALERVNEIVTTLREQAGEARATASTRAQERRARLTKLQEDLPTQFDELRGRLSSEELRKFAETYADAAQTTYNKLVERGEAALERLRSQPGFTDAANRVEGYTDRGVELTQEALGNVAAQTRAVGERAAKLVGVDLPKKAEKRAAPAKKAAKKAPAKAQAKKAPAKKAAAKKVTQK